MVPDTENGFNKDFLNKWVSVQWVVRLVRRKRHRLQDQPREEIQ